MKREWQPWMEFALSKKEEVLPIIEPPCKDCRYWKPLRNYDRYGNFDGVTLCHAEQCHDFSCFRPCDLPEVPVSPQFAEILPALHETVAELGRNQGAHLEMFAAAFLKATDIPPEEAVLVEERGERSWKWHFERRPRKDVTVLEGRPRMDTFENVFLAGRILRNVLRPFQGVAVRLTIEKLEE